MTLSPAADSPSQRHAPTWTGAAWGWRFCSTVPFAAGLFAAIAEWPAYASARSMSSAAARSAG